MIVTRMTISPPPAETDSREQGCSSNIESRAGLVFGSTPIAEFCSMCHVSKNLGSLMRLI